MISAEEFATRWEKGEEEWKSLHDDFIPNTLCKAEAWMMEQKPFSTEVKHFLTQAGLPDSAAPCVSFEETKRGLPAIWETWGIRDDWSLTEILRLQPYHPIGSDGAGNPLCIDTDNSEQIIMLDHEDHFHTLQFVNSSIFHLAEFILIFRDQTITELAENEFRRIDPDALIEGNFWYHEIESSKWFDAHPDD